MRLLPASYLAVRNDEESNELRKSNQYVIEREKNEVYVIARRHDEAIYKKT